MATYQHNRIICKKCRVTISSLHRHDFVWCSCHSVAVDGGLDYLKRMGNHEDYLECSVTLRGEWVENNKELACAFWFGKDNL